MRGVVIYNIEMADIYFLYTALKTINQNAAMLSNFALSKEKADREKIP